MDNFKNLYTKKNLGSSYFLGPFSIYKTKQRGKKGVEEKINTFANFKDIFSSS